MCWVAVLHYCGTLLKQLNFSRILQKWYFVTIVFPINILENILEQLLLPGKLWKAVLGHQVDRKTDQTTFFLHIPFFDTIRFGTYGKYSKRMGQQKILSCYYLFLTMAFASNF